MSRPDFDLSLYLVTDRPLSMGRDMRWIVNEAVRGGCTMVQLREKDCDTREFIELARMLKQELSATGVPLIINDRLDVALAVDADGVHIGQSDMPYEIARRLLGPDKIIGLSVESMKELEEANLLDVDYIGISPIFATATKTDTKTPFGLEGAREAMFHSIHPACGIGGMNHRTVVDVIQHGVDGIAVVSDIVSAPSPCDSSSSLLQLVRQNQGTWCDNVWRVIEPLMEKLRQHPFLQKMAEDTLPRDLFVRYLQQDSIYLSNYSREMRMLAELVTDNDQKAMFARFAQDSMEAEESLHAELLASTSSYAEADALPATAQYMQHTSRLVNSGDLPLAFASLLPCMWIYSELGRYAKSIQQGGDSNPYAQWIDCYTSPVMEEGLPVMQHIVNEMALHETAHRRAAMRRAFCQSASFELDFFSQII